MKKIKNDILIYVDEDNIRVEVFYEDENVWLNTEKISELFEIERSVITKHINNIYKDEELDENSTCAFFAHVGKTGQKYQTKYYNLDMIISIGFRTNSKKAIKFRIWANRIIKDYMIKGFAMDDERLKNNNNPLYFEELLARIREIRSSEKVFWRKILDLYATSIDYNSKAEETITFFKTVQNKMHYASHGSTAAELIYARVDSNKENLGLTNYKGNYPTREETTIAKNYLTLEELDILNRMVYL